MGLAYNSKMPDLYPGNAHNTIGWLLTVLIFAIFIIGVLRSVVKHGEPETNDELTPFIPVGTLEDGDLDFHHPDHPSSARNSLLSPCPTDETDSDTLFDVHLPNNSRLAHSFNKPTSWSRYWSNTSQPRFSHSFSRPNPRPHTPLPPHPRLYRHPHRHDHSNRNFRSSPPNPLPTQTYLTQNPARKAYL